jgi:DMSO reductase family type II enzyme chaperone
MATTSDNITDDLIETRQAVYRFLLAAFDKPSADQYAWFASHAFQDALAELAERFGVPPAATEADAGSVADHEARYLGCFEVGLPAPPVMLQASQYRRHEPPPAVIHEHVLFYQRFGMRQTPDNRETADHLLNELAFLIHLDDLLRKGEGTESVLRARRDFLERQASRWPAQAAAQAVEKRLPDVYATLLALLTAALNDDRDITQTAIAALQEQP